MKSHDIHTRVAPPPAVLHLRGASPGDWPSDEELAQWMALGVVEARVSGWMELGEERPEQSAHFIRFLRDSMSHGLEVDWRGALTGAIPDWALRHLAPPAADEETAARSTAWREHHRYGLCYWRSGPGFVLVKDLRRGEQGARFTLDDPEVLRIFSALAVPRRVSEVAGDAAAEHMLGLLREEHLALQLGEWVVGLPYPLRRWPIPLMAI